MNPLLGLLFATYHLLVPVTAQAQTLPPVLLCIAEHESGVQQFTPTGSPLISPTGDVGIMQINLKSWKAVADTQGLDIVHSAKDNIEFGIWLANKYGYSQWTTYKYCHGSEDS